MAKVVENEYFPDTVSPPGDTLLETIELYGISQNELAERTGRSLKTINEIIKGKAAITSETAMQLERVLGIPARFWNNRDRHYQEYLARMDEEKLLARQVDLLKDAPVKEMASANWIEKRLTKADQVREILSFYGVATPEAYKKIYEGNQTFTYDASATGRITASVVAWLRKGELEARKIDCLPFDERKFHALLPCLRALTRDIDPASSLMLELQRLCAECGVAVVFVPELPDKQSAKPCGAARWQTPKRPVVQLSPRLYDEGDIWFTFFHEVAHLLLHGKKERFVDFEVGVGKEQKEAEADEFAHNLLIPKRAWKRFVAENHFSERLISQFAEEFGVERDLVIGRLRSSGVIR